MGETSLGIIASSRAWRTELQAHVRDHVAGIKVQIIREPRMALETELDVIIIDDVSTFLSRSKVQYLQSRGVRVVGIYDPEEQEGLGQGYLDQLGVDLALPSTTSPEDMLFAVEQMQPTRRAATGDAGFDSVISGFEFGAQEAPTLAPARGRVIAVAGPGGSGATEVAIGIADAIALRRDVALLIDADEAAPTIGRRLCYQLQPNILSAIDAALHQTHPLPHVVGRRLDQAPGHIGFHVVPGIANPDDWSQMRGHDVTDLITEARRSWGYTVINAGRSIEDLSAYGFERFGASRAVLTQADVVVAVCQASPVGLLRLFDWLAAFHTLGRDVPVFVVFNRAPNKKFVQAQIEAQLYEHVDQHMIAGHAFVPEDGAVLAAEWEGRLVAKGGFTKAMTALAALVAPSVRTAPTRRERQAEKSKAPKQAKVSKQAKQPKAPKAAKVAAPPKERKPARPARPVRQANATPPPAAPPAPPVAQQPVHNVPPAAPNFDGLHWS
jgi:CO dehydrogenase nickel-insertion accessory protein CooC1